MEGVTPESLHPDALSEGPSDATTAALALALERASAAGEWAVVAALAAELAARRTVG